MYYESISVKLSAEQLKEAVKVQVSKDFPNHHIVKLTVDANGGATVEMKKLGNYADR